MMPMMETRSRSPSLSKRPPMVGRDLERGRLGQLLERTLAGQGGLVMVSGESGVGKTRLAEELAAEAARVRALALTGHCYETEEAPYVPFAEILYSALRGTTEEQFRAALVRYGPDVAKLMPEMRRVFPDIPPPLQLPPEQERRYLFDSLCELLEQASRAQPLLLILEDLHWSDSSTLTLLQHLARRLRVMRVLVLGTFRDAEPDKSGAFESALAELFRHRLAERVVLKRLPEGEVKALLEALGGPDVPDPVVRAIYDETEGNAFFVEEAFKHLAEEGKLFDAIGNWLPGIELSEGDVPDNVRLVVGRRFQRLSDLCREILTHAAVIGREFEARLLEVVAGRDREAVLQIIEEAERAHVLRAVQVRERRFAFAHELIRQTVLSEVSTFRRQRLHMQVATAMEQLYLPAGDAQSLEEHASSLAYHFIQAGPGGDVDKAIDYAGRAAKQAASQLAFEEAAQFYQKALEALESKAAADDTPRCQLLLSLGEVKNWAGDWQGGKHAFLKAADLARHSQAPEQLARAALGVAGTAQGAAVNQTAVDLLEEALRALERADGALRARVMARLAAELYYIDSSGRRAALSREAIEMARRLDDPGTLARVLGAAVWGLWRPDNIEERLPLVREMIELAEEVGERETSMRGHQLLLGDLLALGDIPQFEAEIEALARLAQESRQPIWIWCALELGAMQAMMEGRFGEGERLAQQALATGEDGRAAPNARGLFCVQMLGLRREQGRLHEIEPMVKRFIDRSPAVALWRAALVYLYCDSQREAEARGEFEALAQEDFRRIPKDAFWLAVIMFLAESCAYLRDAGRAASLYSLLLPYAQHNIVFAAGAAVYGSASRYLGLLATAMCRWQEAEKHFEDALEMNARMGARPWVAWTQHDYAKMLLARRQLGDRKRAHALFAEALNTAEALGMNSLIEKVTVLLQSGRSLMSIYPDGLTQREVDVLRLVAAGKSSRGIGAELFLSVRTVERHITHIYSKIDARTRSQATAYALSRGLWTPSA